MKMRGPANDHPDGATRPNGWRHGVWLALLVGASIAFSLGFACAVPLAAFGAAAALTPSRRDGIVLVLAVWLANQVIGFAVLHYPWTASTFAWGFAMGAAAVLATVAARWAARRLAGHGQVGAYVASFAAAFVVYECALFVVAATSLGGVEDFAPSIVGPILVLNVVAAAALFVANGLGTRTGFVAAPMLVPTINRT